MFHIVSDGAKHVHLLVFMFQIVSIVIYRLRWRTRLKNLRWTSRNGLWYRVVLCRKRAAGWYRAQRLSWMVQVWDSQLLWIWTSGMQSKIFFVYMIENGLFKLLVPWDVLKCLETSLQLLVPWNIMRNMFAVVSTTKSFTGCKKCIYSCYLLRSIVFH